MADAYIYDAVRTPRGRGKTDGALHEATALHLATHVLKAVRDRNELDTALVDDVVLGVVSPVKEPSQEEKLKWWNADDSRTIETIKRDREQRELVPPRKIDAVPPPAITTRLIGLPCIISAPRAQARSRGR